MATVPSTEIISLRGKVALVAGSSRGAGAGVARALGAAGATVYVTGRSVRGGPPPSDGAAGTVQGTAEEVTRRGGVGVPASCDHTDDEQVAALFRRIHSEQGRLDLLVNAVWGGNEVPSLQADWGRPFWEVEAAPAWDKMFNQGVRAALIASHHAARLMAAQDSGLIVNVTFCYPDRRYVGHLMYDLAKHCLSRMAFGLAEELRPHGVCAVAVSPGHMRTERVLAHFNTGVEQTRENVAVAAAGGRAAGTAWLMPHPPAHLPADPASSHPTCLPVPAY